MYLICNHHWKIELALTTAEEARVENCQQECSLEIEREIIEDRRNNETLRDSVSLEDIWTEGKNEFIYAHGEPRPTNTCEDNDTIKRYSR